MRSISDEFQSELHSGTLKWVTDAVKDRTNNLILCFRDGYVNVYYKSHSLFKITQHQRGYRLSFNLRHARYTEPMEAAKSRIKAILPEIRFSASDEVWFYSDMIPKNAQTQIIDAYKSYIDDFFDLSKLTDYIHPSRKRDLLEKVRQQELFSAHFDPMGIGEELVFYDMELSIPGESSDIAKKGSPDCLAVKLQDGVVTEIVLVEVKSAAAACVGNHGIKKHCEDFYAILQNPDDRGFLYASMVCTLNHYQSLWLLSAVNDVCSLEKCKFSIRYYFTDEAIRWTKNSRQRNENYEYYLRLPAEQMAHRRDYPPKKAPRRNKKKPSTRRLT